VLFEEAKKIIAGARREILILNWSAEEAFEEDVRRSRDNYYEHLVECSSRLKYSRVIQAKNYWRDIGAKSIAETFEESYLNHFSAMLMAQEKQRLHGSYSTELFVVPPSIPSTFLIADDNYLIWQLNEVRNPSSTGVPHWQIRGAIVVHDPGGEIIKQFRATFDRAKGERFRPLDSSDLVKAEQSDVDS
jgi:hypothetical protein